MLHQRSLWLHELSFASCAFARGSAWQFGVGSSVAVPGAVSWHTSHTHTTGLLGYTGTLVPATLSVLGRGLPQVPM